MPVISRFFALPSQALRHWGLLACVGLGFGLNTSALAQSDEPPLALALSPSLSLKGFGTLGLARSDSSTSGTGFVRDLSQPSGVKNKWSGLIDSLIGLQANYRFNSSTEAVVQGVSHYRYDSSFTPDLTTAYISHDISPRLTFRAGRLATEFLIQANSRMIGYSYLPVRPASDFYAGVPINYADGADAQLRWPVGEGVFRFGFLAGLAREKLPFYDVNNAKVLQATVGFDQGPWQFRGIYVHGRLSNEVEGIAPLRLMLQGVGAQNVANDLSVVNKPTHYASLGVSYDDGSWQFQANLNSIRHQNVLFENSRSGYVQLGHRFGSVSPFIGYSRTLSSPKSLSTGLPDLYFGQLNAGVQQALRSNHADQYTTTVGARWDFRRNMDLKAQLDMVRADPNSRSIFHNPDPSWNGRVNVLSVAMDFIF